MVICLSSAALVTGAVNALTLDSSILRDIPYFQKFLITVDGDTSSSASVELSGSDNHAIKLSDMVGTDDVLIAPGGLFSHTSEITGLSFASGSLTPSDF